MLQNTQEIQKTHDITEENKPKQQNFTDICDKFHVEQTLLRQTKFNKFQKMGMVPGMKKYRPHNNPKQLNLLDKQEIKEQFKESTEKIESVLDFYKDYYLKKRNYLKTKIEKKNKKEENFDFFNKIKEVLRKNDEISEKLEHEISTLTKEHNHKLCNFSDLVNFIDNLSMFNERVLSIYKKLGVRMNNMHIISGFYNSSKLSLKTVFKYSLMLGYDIDINIKFNKHRYKKLLDKKNKLDDYVRIENNNKGQMTYKFLNKKLFNMN